MSWPPGHENVPDCNPLIQMNGNAVAVKGVKVVTPTGIGVEGGEFSRDPKVLQTASDAAIRADQEFVRLCSQLPSYANDREQFYALRKKMSDIALNDRHGHGGRHRHGAVDPGAATSSSHRRRLGGERRRCRYESDRGEPAGRREHRHHDGYGAVGEWGCGR